jgi:glycosyltransferase involved in cell wall biosynthesis
MRRRVLVLSEDPVGTEMGGNAIRAYELARVLGEHADVTLAAPVSDTPPHDVAHVDLPYDDPRWLRAHMRDVDVVVALPQNPVVAAALRHTSARVVYDLYDPKPLQIQEAFATASPLVRRYWSTIALDHVMEALRLGDFLICASERQRDLWIGAMLAQGLITPAAYRADPTWRSAIAVVPFGVPEEPPHSCGRGPFERFGGLGQPAEIVLWNGGLWNWLDPVCAVDAIARVAKVRPHARLVFMGRPPPPPHQADAAAAARARAEHLGLLGKLVFFNDAWVPYRDRADWLLAADCALSLQVEHLETRFSFRTRVLDCFWAGLPVVCTEGDELADLVARRQLGAVVPASDADSAANAMVSVLERGRAAFREALALIADEYRWPRVADPLIQYVSDPRDQSLRGRRRQTSRGRGVRSAGTRAARSLLRALRRFG